MSLCELEDKSSHHLICIFQQETSTISVALINVQQKAIQQKPHSEMEDVEAPMPV